MEPPHGPKIKIALWTHQLIGTIAKQAPGPFNPQSSPLTIRLLCHTLTQSKIYTKVAQPVTPQITMILYTRQVIGHHQRNDRRKLSKELSEITLK